MGRLFLLALITWASTLSAWAQGHHGSETLSGGVEHAASASRATMPANFSEELSACGSGVLKGAWDSTGGLVVGAAQCAGNPIECVNQTAQGLQGFFSFMTNLVPEVQRLTASIAHTLPPGQLASVVCSATASVLVDVGLAMLTMGAAAGKLGVTVARVMARITRLVALTKRLTSVPLGRLMEMSEEALKEIDRLLAKGQLDRLQGILQACAM